MAISLVYRSGRPNDGFMDLGFSTFDLTHAGQESHFMAVSDGREISRVYKNGFINVAELEQGPEGFVGVGRTSSKPGIRPTFGYSSSMRNFCVAFDGYLFNGNELREKMGGTDDADVVARFVADADGFEKGMENLANEARGHYCVNMVTEKGGAYSAVSPMMVRILSYGHGERGSAVVSESRALSHIGMFLQRDLEPGEIAEIGPEGMETLKHLGGKRRICSFLWPYYAMPDSVIQGIPAALVRQRIGRWHGRQDDGEYDIVCPVPDSGKVYPEGYSEQAGAPNREALKKYPFAGRSYDRPDQQYRDLIASLKITVIPSLAEGKRIVVMDDSVRRGTQLVKEGGPVDLLRKAGAREIHLRVCSPRNLAYCRCSPPDNGGYHDDELAANNFGTDQKLADHLGIDSVRFIDIDPFVDSIIEGSDLTRDDLSLGCYTDDFGYLE